jgi:uncharacterized protein
MSELRPGKLVRVHLSEHDRVGARQAFEALIDKCRELGVSGASVFRGLEGFGESSEILRPRMWNGDQPIVVTVVESAEVVERILPELRSLVPDAMIAISDVRMLRIQRSVA